MATPSSYSAGPHATSSAAEPRRLKKQLLPSILFSSIILLPLVLVIVDKRPAKLIMNSCDVVETTPSTSDNDFSPARPLTEPPLEGVSEVASENVFRQVSDGGLTFSWSNVMLSWQRTAYHFQPEKNWMNVKVYQNNF
ncbi:UNVERIFIED_CONTAM: Acid beta-fructofuranosidase AIV-18 [Sesamum radiatum]|uniref:Acid beta-fructofuranosidase AIV-18 n=1 Tax=Sesamum radiatum TaxID=300843 RepID=A0AAW2TEU0_SESRA